MTKIRRPRPIPWYIIWFIIFLFFTASVLSLFFSIPLFRIKYIQVEGTRILSSQKIKEKIDIKIGENIIFADYSEVKALFSGITQIKDYGIYRKFPNTIVIKILERKPAAVLISQGESMVVDLEGYILKVASGLPRSKTEKLVQIENISELPVIRGFTKNMIGKDVMLPATTSRMIMDSIGSLEKFLEPSSLQLELKGEDGVILLVQDILKVKLGDRRRIKEKIVVLKSLLPAIQGKWDDIEYVDIRYPESPVIVYK